MYSSRLAGAQQPTVLLSLKSCIIMAQLRAPAKWILDKHAAGSKMTLPFLLTSWFREVINRNHPLTLTSSSFSFLNSSWSSSRRRIPNIPNMLETTESPKTSSLRLHKEVWYSTLKVLTLYNHYTIIIVLCPFASQNYNLAMQFLILTEGHIFNFAYNYRLLKIVSKPALTSLHARVPKMRISYHQNAKLIQLTLAQSKCNPIEVLSK